MNAMNIHIIVGLPGSGKTTFANTLNCEVVDDPNDLNLVANKTADFAITHPAFCDINSFNKLVALLNENYSTKFNVKITTYCFTNDTIQCIENDVCRNRPKNSRNYIKHLSKQYNIDNYKDAILLNTYKHDNKHDNQ